MLSTVVNPGRFGDPLAVLYVQEHDNMVDDQIPGPHVQQILHVQLKLVTKIV